MRGAAVVIEQTDGKRFSLFQSLNRIRCRLSALPSAPRSSASRDADAPVAAGVELRVPAWERQFFNRRARVFPSRARAVGAFRGCVSKRCFKCEGAKDVPGSRTRVSPLSRAYPKPGLETVTAPTNRDARQVARGQSKLVLRERKRMV